MPINGRVDLDQASLAVLLSCLEAKLIVTAVTALSCLISTHFYIMIMIHQ